MERYFLGNNTAYGFFGNYDEELRNKNKVVLLKGGPGTGKSSILKKVAAEAKSRGLDYELWYCSGDPASLDGVYVKQLDTAIVDATAPHASGADLPKIKDFLYDLASSLSHAKLKEHKEVIEKLTKDKKWYFMRAYQHLKSALCHFNNQIQLEMQGLKVENVRAYAAVLASDLRAKCKDVLARRKVFTHAICPKGENVYYDHLRGKTIFKVDGSAAAKKIFFDELAGHTEGGTVILNPLDPNVIDGLVHGSVAIVADAGHLKNEVSENVNLRVYEGALPNAAIEEEKNGVITQIAFCEEQLENARERHLGMEKYFISAMDFDNNDRIYGEIRQIIFG
ncbi:MAG: hypothetical protein NC037_01620 [Bacteroides sp.]|nr:hypothetical protein [Bacillota bacterium]MCM1393688.1 hypothetical protein [[Eubacterium] siraeum]MCM1455213.1 hypothetical protein [Bacteroides sp.]